MRCPCRALTIQCLQARLKTTRTLADSGETSAQADSTRRGPQHTKKEGVRERQAGGREGSGCGAQQGSTYVRGERAHTGTSMRNQKGKVGGGHRLGYVRVPRRPLANIGQNHHYYGHPLHVLRSARNPPLLRIPFPSPPRAKKRGHAGVHPPHCAQAHRRTTLCLPGHEWRQSSSAKGRGREHEVQRGTVQEVEGGRGGGGSASELKEADAPSQTANTRGRSPAALSRTAQSMWHSPHERQQKRKGRELMRRAEEGKRWRVAVKVECTRTHV